MKAHTIVSFVAIAVTSATALPAGQATSQAAPFRRPWRTHSRGHVALETFWQPPVMTATQPAIAVSTAPVVLTPALPTTPASPAPGVPAAITTLGAPVALTPVISVAPVAAVPIPTIPATPVATTVQPQPTSSNPGAGAFSGDGTFYSPGLGSCGINSSESELVAAINAPQYGTTPNPNNAPVCGRCALVTGPNGQVKVKIVDRCPVCKTGDLDLSPAAFNQIGSAAAGRIKISWSFVGC